MAKSTRKSEIRKTSRPVGTGRRRWFNFGPGIAIALILSAFVVYTRYQDQAQRTPPRIERTVLSDAPIHRGAGIAPDISFLLERHQQLHLSAQQTKDIQRLQTEWKTVSAPLREQADRATQQFRAWMDESAKRGSVGLNEIQKQGAEVSALSAQLAQQRRAYWQSALILLTEEQRTQIQRELKQPSQGKPTKEK